MKDNNYFLNDVKGDLEKAFESYYDLTFGFYNLNAPQEKKIRNLSKLVKNEFSEKGGKLYEIFEKIWEIKRDIYDLEYEVKKDNKDFDVDNGMAVRICDLYDDVMRELGKLMFMYGMGYGRNLEHYLSEFTLNDTGEKNHGE